MPIVTKIKKHGLENEIYNLINTGMSLQDTADTINRTHEDININKMTLSRFMKSKQVQEIQKELNEGKDVETQLRDELRNKMTEWEDETHEIYTIMKRALKKMVKEDDNWKIIKAAKDTLNAIDQSRRNLITKVEKGFKRFGYTDEAKQVNYVQINNLLIAASDELCPKCRKKIVDLITTKEKQDGD